MSKYNLIVLAFVHISLQKQKIAMQAELTWRQRNNILLYFLEIRLRRRSRRRQGWKRIQIDRNRQEQIENAKDQKQKEFRTRMQTDGAKKEQLPSNDSNCEMVDDIGLFRGLKNMPPACFLRSAERRPARWIAASRQEKVAWAILVLRPRKKSVPPHGATDSLVDDIGLEPMTFRTSSGCSSQLS